MTKCTYPCGYLFFVSTSLPHIPSLAFCINLPRLIFFSLFASSILCVYNSPYIYCFVCTLLHVCLYTLVLILLRVYNLPCVCANWVKKVTALFKIPRVTLFKKNHCAMQEPIQLSTTFKNDQDELKNQISRSGVPAIRREFFFCRTFHIINTHPPTKTAAEAFYFIFISWLLVMVWR